MSGRRRKTANPTGAAAGPGAGHAAFVVPVQRIRLSDLTVACRIGVTDEERALRQRLRVNIELEVRPAPPREDHIGEVVDYGPLVANIRKACADAECRLLETLAGQIAAACFFDARVLAARVRVEKLDRYPDVGGIGCDIEYRRRSA
ncbi:MAG: dihydroneopterin aldolase [Kiloniellaceae bacterium]